MESDYFVLYKRDFNGEKLSRAKGRMLYDKSKDFCEYASAITFANRNLPALVVKRTPLNEEDSQKIKDTDKPYVVAAFFPMKYRHYCYDGSSDPVPTSEVVRCAENELEKVVEKLSSEGAQKVDLGIELRFLGVGVK